MKYSLFFFFFSLIFFAYCSELFLRLSEKYITIPDNIEREYNKTNNTKFEKRKRLDYYKYISKTKNILPDISPVNYLNKTNYKIFPLSGISNQLTLVCNENGYYSEYESDRHGFNNPDYVWEAEIIDYVIIGDSLAYGACVNRPYDIASILRENYELNVINLAYGGNGPLIELASLREYLKPNTKKILYLFNEMNDLDEVSREIKNNFLYNYLTDPTFTQSLITRQDEINTLHYSEMRNVLTALNSKNRIIHFIKLSYFREILLYRAFDKIKKNYKNNFSSNDEDHEKLKNLNKIESYKTLKNILEQANNLSKKNNSKLYFVYLPEYKRYKQKSYYNPNYLKIKELVYQLNIPFVDINELTFENLKDPLSLFPLRYFYHYNKIGYRKVATDIFDHIN
jgi:hypothetical protein